MFSWRTPPFFCPNALHCTCPSAHGASKVMCWLGDVETDGVETSFPGILFRNYLLFSLLRKLPTPSNQNNLKVFPFGKAACVVDVCRPPPPQPPPTWQTKTRLFSHEVGGGVERRLVCPLIGQVHSGRVWNCAQVCGGPRLHRRPHPRWPGRNSAAHRDAFTRPNEVQLRGPDHGHQRYRFLP